MTDDTTSWIKGLCGGRWRMPTIEKVSTDKRYKVSSKGVILDTKTNLEWFVGPDEDTDWCKAKAWAKGLCGGRWRMPTIEELREIYEKDKGNRNIERVFKIAGWWVWAKDTYKQDSLSAFVFDFYLGCEGWLPRSHSYNIRGFMVRSAK